MSRNVHNKMDHVAQALPLTAGGKIFMVADSSAEGYNAILERFASIDAYYAAIDTAINACIADRGDIIYVAPNYTQTISAAAGIALDVAGVSVIGLGTGRNRPTLTFDGTDATPSVTFGAANCAWKNIVHVINEASLTHALDVGLADDLTIEDCEFVEGSATPLTFITADGADASCDRLHIKNCTFYCPTAGNGDAAITIGTDLTNVVIEGCEIDGDWDLGGIYVPAGGNAQVNMRILNCNVKNRLTNVAAISINGTGSSGIIKDCLLRTDTKASALDNGSLATSNVRWADETDQVSDSPIFVEVDSVSNVLGANDSDNGFDSSSVAANVDGSVLERLEDLVVKVTAVDDILDTEFPIVATAVGAVADAAVADTVEGAAMSTQSILSDIKAVAQRIGADNANNTASTAVVVANVDGSVLERLEALMDPLGGYDPVLGFRVTKTSSMASDPDSLFTVTGRCLITHLSGEVTTQIGTTTTMLLQDTTNTVDLCAATTITGDVVGTMYHFDGVKSAVLNSGIAPVVGTTSLANGGYQPVVWGDAQAAITISHNLDAGGTGAVDWVLYYKPLTASSTIVAAA